MKIAILLILALILISGFSGCTNVSEEESLSDNIEDDNNISSIDEDLGELENLSLDFDESSLE